MRHLLGVVLAGFVLALFLGRLPVRAQSTYDHFGSGRTSALGYASTALGTTAGVHANPAAGAVHDRRLVSFYTREAFGLSALRYGAGYVSWPVDWGTFSAGAGTIGNDEYREIQYSLGYARSVRLGTSRPLHVGAVARYYTTRIQGYGSAGAVGIHFGILVSLLPSLQLGARATNVNGPSLVDGEQLPQTLQIGLRYRATRQLLVLFDVSKDVSFPTAFRSGLEVRPIPMLALRAGVATAPTRFTAGAGLRLSRLRVHLAAEQHAHLGWTPSASLEIHW